jgi:hypothetical protein
MHPLTEMFNSPQFGMAAFYGIGVMTGLAVAIIWGMKS